MDLKKELLDFRKWQEENWKNVFLYSENLMVETYLIDTGKALIIDSVSSSFYCDNIEEEGMLQCGKQCDFCKNKT